MSVPTDILASEQTIRGRARVGAEDLPSEDRPTLTVVVPTRNECETILPLLLRLDAVARRLRFAVLFVDDSTDATPDAIRRYASVVGFPVSVIHRPPPQRHGGLGGAVVTALNLVQTDWVCVMDADLQHPPELVVALVTAARTSHADVVVASRYCAGGDVGAFSALRSVSSRSAGLLARALFPRQLRAVSDPLSGFFLVRPAAVDLSALQPRGFKILLEILLSGSPLATAEVPFSFGQRCAGKSKASLREGGIYLRRLLALRARRRRRRKRTPAPTVIARRVAALGSDETLTAAVPAAKPSPRPSRWRV